MKSKQVIILRSDLRNEKGEKIRKGKYISQGAHASMKALIDMGEVVNNELRIPLYGASMDWIQGIFTKVALKVGSEEELLEIYQKGCEAGIPCALIVDAGLTEFGGIPTKTAVAIGPAWDEEIDKITGHLPLFN